VRKNDDFLLILAIGGSSTFDFRMLFCALAYLLRALAFLPGAPRGKPALQCCRARQHGLKQRAKFLRLRDRDVHEPANLVVPDLSGNLIVQLGVVTEELNRRWYEANSGQEVIDVQKHIRHPGLHWMGATLDGRVRASGAVFESKFMLPWAFSEEAAVQKYAPQLQHSLWVVAARTAILSVITGGGKWIEIEVPADPLYQHLIVTAERKFWRCVESGEPPALFGVDPPKPRIEVVRIVDMASSNVWAEFSTVFLRTRTAHLEHEAAKAELKSLVPADAQQAFGHGVRARRSKSGAISFDLLSAEGKDAAGE
jgi:hypothetical protein